MTGGADRAPGGPAPSGRSMSTTRVTAVIRASYFERQPGGAYQRKQPDPVPRGHGPAARDYLANGVSGDPVISLDHSRV
jgi:hypothetical protein